MPSQGKERSEQIKQSLDMPQNTFAEKIRKLDKLNQFFIPLLVDSNKVGIRLAAFDRQVDPPVSEQEWATKAAFSQERMQDDLQKVIVAQAKLETDIAAEDPKHHILEDCARLRAQQEHELTKLYNPGELNPVSQLEEDYPSNDHFIFEEGIEEEEEEYTPVNKWKPEPTTEDVYNAYFRQAAEELVDSSVLKQIDKRATASVNTYELLHARG